MYQLYRDRPLLVFCMVIANLALSAWCIYSDPVINNDGITYMAISQMFLDGQWQAAFDYYSWPFYSMFIAATSKLLFIELETAAYLLNTLLITSLTLAFVCIVGELSNNNKRIILIAMVVILLFPSISKYRSFVIRDFGYLSCYLWSLYFIFRFCSTLHKQHLIGWLFFAVLSCLFRFEGIAFLLIAPYFLLLFTASKLPHRKKILTALSVAIVVISCTLLYWYLNDKYNNMIAIAKVNGDDIDNVLDLFFSNLQQRFGQDSTLMGVLVTSLSEVAYELIRRMAVFYFVFAIYAYVTNMVLQQALIRRVWLVFIATNLVVLIGFSLYNSFLVSRYTMATALTLLILAPFVINKIWQAFENAKPGKKTAAIATFLLLGFVSLEGLNVQTSKTYIKTAGHWMRDNIPAGSTIYGNSRIAIYYSMLDPKGTITQVYNNEQVTRLINTDQIRNFDFVAMKSSIGNKLDSDLNRSLEYKFGTPIHISRGIEDDTVLVYKVKRQGYGDYFE